MSKVSSIDMSQPMNFPSRIKLPYTWHVGRYGSRFYNEIKENCKLWGTKCPKCGKVFVPPRDTCIHCYENIFEWVELGNTGTLLSYTIVRYQQPEVQPIEAPFALGIIQLDGASNGLTHFIGEIDFHDIKIGMRLQVVFQKKRTGSYLDISHFAPL